MRLIIFVVVVVRIVISFLLDNLSLLIVLLCFPSNLRRLRRLRSGGMFSRRDAAHKCVHDSRVLLTVPQGRATAMEYLGLSIHDV